MDTFPNCRHLQARTNFNPNFEAVTKRSSLYFSIRSTNLSLFSIKRLSDRNNSIRIYISIRSIYSRKNGRAYIFPFEARIYPYFRLNDYPIVIIQFEFIFRYSFLYPLLSKIFNIALNTVRDN